MSFFLQRVEFCFAHLLNYLWITLIVSRHGWNPPSLGPHPSLLKPHMNAQSVHLGLSILIKPKLQHLFSTIWPLKSLVFSLAFSLLLPTSHPAHAQLSSWPKILKAFSWRYLGLLLSSSFLSGTLTLKSLMLSNSDLCFFCLGRLKFSVWVLFSYILVWKMVSEKKSSYMWDLLENSSTSHSITAFLFWLFSNTWMSCLYIIQFSQLFITGG